MFLQMSKSLFNQLAIECFPSVENFCHAYSGRFGVRAVEQRLGAVKMHWYSPSGGDSPVSPLVKFAVSDQREDSLRSIELARLKL